MLRVGLRWTVASSSCSGGAWPVETSAVHAGHLRREAGICCREKTFFTLFFFLVEELGHVMVFVVTEFRPNSIHRE